MSYGPGQYHRAIHGDMLMAVFKRLSGKVNVFLSCVVHIKYMIHKCKLLKHICMLVVFGIPSRLSLGFAWYVCGAF